MFAADKTILGKSVTSAPVGL